MAFLSHDEIAALGLRRWGERVFISRLASLHNPQAIDLGSNVRIDDFCVLSAGMGGIAIGSFVHIGVCSSLIGAARITLADYCNISSRVSIYSSNDDYSGNYLTNPMVPSSYTNVKIAPVSLGRHTIIGSGSIILPGVTIHDGVAIGALSLVKTDCEAFTVCGGVPARRLRERSRRLLELEAAHRTQWLMATNTAPSG